MTATSLQTLRDLRVAIAKTSTLGYRNSSVDAQADAERAITQTAESLGWSDQQHGPFGKVIPNGARVVVKPNLVMHQNEGPWGIEPLITHVSLVGVSSNSPRSSFPNSFGKLRNHSEPLYH